MPQDIGDLAVLSRYESEHRRASLPLYLGTNALVGLYTDERMPARLLRSAVLRIAGYELAHRLDVPYRVVINEAIETTKRFGAEQGHTYVNGVLDRAAAEWRAVEIQGARR